MLKRAHTVVFLSLACSSFSFAQTDNGTAASPPNQTQNMQQQTQSTAPSDKKESGQQTYLLDPNHTYVEWRVSHFGFSSPSGKFLASGTLLVDETKPQDSKLNVTIKTDSLETGIPKFTQHLKSADFLETAKYPEAKFESKSITITGKDTAKIAGELTLHGVTKPVTLDVKLNKVDISPISNKRTGGFSATTSINRSDFGINKFLPGVADKVSMNIEVEAVKSDETNVETETPKNETQAP